MSAGTFLLAIELRNAALVDDDGEGNQTPALPILGRMVQAVGLLVENGQTEGPIFDYNGNAVGRFEVRPDGDVPTTWGAQS